MAESIHPEATHNLPSFITAPGETDVLMVVTALILMAAVVAFGVLFLRLHALPERIAHGTHKVQLEIVSVLCLIALFTHMHIFWIAALILAFVELPDFGYPLRRIAGSVEKMAGVTTDEGTAAIPSEPIAHDGKHDETHAAPSDVASKPTTATPTKKKLSHA